MNRSNQSSNRQCRCQRSARSEVMLRAEFVLVNPDPFSTKNQRKPPFPITQPNNYNRPSPTSRRILMGFCASGGARISSPPSLLLLELLEPILRALAAASLTSTRLSERVASPPWISVGWEMTSLPRVGGSAGVGVEGRQQRILGITVSMDVRKGRESGGRDGGGGGAYSRRDMVGGCVDVWPGRRMRLWVSYRRRVKKLTEVRLMISLLSEQEDDVEADKCVFVGICCCCCWLSEFALNQLGVRPFCVSVRVEDLQSPNCLIVQMQFSFFCRSIIFSRTISNTPKTILSMVSCCVNWC